LLRDIINKYNDFCRKGFASKTVLKFQASFIDNPSFGEWHVTVRQFNIQRSVSQPLLFQYNLNLICITNNLQDLGRTASSTSSIVDEIIGVEPEQIVVRTDGETASVVTVVASTAEVVPVVKQSDSKPAVVDVKGQPPVPVPVVNEVVVTQIIPKAVFPYTVPGDFRGLVTTLDGIRYAILEGKVVNTANAQYFSAVSGVGTAVPIRSTMHELVFTVPDEPDRFMVVVANPTNTYGLLGIYKQSITSMSYIPKVAAGQNNSSNGLQKLNSISNNFPINTEIWTMKNPFAGTATLRLIASAEVPVLITVHQFSHVDLNDPLYGADFTSYDKRNSPYGVINNLGNGDMVLGILAGNYLSSQAYAASDLTTVFTNSVSRLQTSAFVEGSFMTAAQDTLTQQIYKKSISDNSNQTSLSATFEPSSIASNNWTFSYFGIRGQRTIPPGIGDRVQGGSLATVPPRTISEILHTFWKIETGSSKKSGSNFQYQYENVLAEFNEFNPELIGKNVDEYLQENSVVQIPDKYRNNMIGN
jgi:hypothetical protein